MPIYEYRCTDGHTFEVLQSMTDDPVSACEVCGEPVERVFHPIAVHFKGSGFYTTDYAKKNAPKTAATDAGSDSKGSKSETSSSSDSSSSSSSSNKSESKSSD